MKDRATEGEIINILNSEIYTILYALERILDVMMVPFQIVIRFYWLYLFFEWTFIPSLIAHAIYTFYMYYYYKDMMKVWEESSNLSDEYNDLITQTFNNLKILKLYSWETNFKEKVSMCLIS